jgi:recombination protein RecT
MTKQIAKKADNSVINAVMSDGFKKQLARALPKHVDTEKFLRISLTNIRNNESLQKCTPISVLASLMKSAQLGLEPGDRGYAYLIPFKNKGVLECQFQPGYKGLSELVTRSGLITHIYPRAVYENDDISVEYGLNEDLKHKPDLLNPRGKLIGVYAIAYFKDGGKQFEFLTKSDVEKIRKTSKAASSSFSPWNTFYDAMAKKTVIKQVAKYLPSSTELQQAIEWDDKADLGTQNKDLDFNVIDGDTGEILNEEPPQPQAKKIAQELTKESSKNVPHEESEPEIPFE